MKKHKITGERQTEDSGHLQPSVQVFPRRATEVLILCSAIVCFAGLSTSLGADIRPRRIDTPSNSTELPVPPPVNSVLAPEQEAAALKKEEIELAEKLMEDFPENVNTIVLMGNVYHSHGNAAKAISSWRKALGLNPRRADVYKSMGWFAMSREEYEKAIARWRHALEIDPQIPGVHNGIARALMGLGRHDEAIEELQKEIQISPKSGFSHFLLGQEYLQQKQYSEAKESYEEAVLLQPNLTNAYYGLFTVCARLKLRDKAQEYMAIFKKLKAEDMKILKDRNDAFDDLVNMRKNAAQTYMHAEQMYRTRADFQTAEKLLKRAVALDPENAACLMRLASLYHASNRMQEALPLYKKVRQIEPGDPSCHWNIGIISVRLKQFAEAQEAFGKVIELAPQDSPGYRSLAQLYLETNKKFPEARKLAEKAVELEKSASNYFVLAWARDKNGDTDGALAAIKRAVELDPDNPRYRRVYELIQKRNSRDNL
jgi:tetratricopeptide (TPR) repeat protein